MKGVIEDESVDGWKCGAMAEIRLEFCDGEVR